MSRPLSRSSELFPYNFHTLEALDKRNYLNSLRFVVDMNLIIVISPQKLTPSQRSYQPDHPSACQIHQ